MDFHLSIDDQLYTKTKVGYWELFSSQGEFLFLNMASFVWSYAFARSAVSLVASGCQDVMSCNCKLLVQQKTGPSNFKF